MPGLSPTAFAVKFLARLTIMIPGSGRRLTPAMLDLTPGCLGVTPSFAYFGVPPELSPAASAVKFLARLTIMIPGSGRRLTPAMLDLTPGCLGVTPSFAYFDVTDKSPG